MRILLFGKEGQVGWELQRSLAPLGDLISVDVDSTELCGNFTDLTGISATVRSVAPNVIVNAAAYTSVDNAEGDPLLSHAINALAPAAIAAEARINNAWFVHYSTDYVFDGSGTAPWSEESPTTPLNVYGKTKLAGEEAISTSGCKHLIFRTSWVHAMRGENFPKKILRLAKTRNQLSVIDDQIGAPTGADLLADVTAHAIRMVVQRCELGGLYHVVAGGETDWLSYARLVVQIARASGFEVNVADDAIFPMASSGSPAPALRPKNSRMATTKIQQAFGLTLPRWEDGVQRLVRELCYRQINTL